MGRHEDPNSPKDTPLDPKQGGQGSNDDENRTGSGQHGDGQGGKK
ncbi:hypothetical protein [Nonomuraea sp. B1E8]